MNLIRKWYRFIDVLLLLECHMFLKNLGFRMKWNQTIWSNASPMSKERKTWEWDRKHFIKEALYICCKKTLKTDIISGGMGQSILAKMGLELKNMLGIKKKLKIRDCRLGVERIYIIYLEFSSLFFLIHCLVTKLVDYNRNILCFRKTKNLLP